MNDTEKLIPAAVAAIRAELRRQGEERYDGPYVDGQGHEEFACVDGWVSLAQVARVALAVFEKAHTPTDDDRESLAEVIEVLDMHGQWPVDQIVDAVLAGGFRRPNTWIAELEARIEELESSDIWHGEDL